MSKEFEIEMPVTEEVCGYGDKILRIINDVEERVRSIEPDAVLNKELHEQKYIDARAEVKNFEKIREDVCRSFGVTVDSDHVYIHQGPGDGNQRALRAFFVLIDTIRKEGFYGEGRIDHNTLFRNLAEKIRAIDGVTTFDSITSTFKGNELRYLVFKGFLSLKEFKELSDTSRRVLETPIVDQNGSIIETPSTWFVTGHNVPEK